MTMQNLIANPKRQLGLYVRCLKKVAAENLFPSKLLYFYEVFKCKLKNLHMYHNFP